MEHSVHRQRIDAHGVRIGGSERAHHIGSIRTPDELHELRLGFGAKFGERPGRSYERQHTLLEVVRV